MLPPKAIAVTAMAVMASVGEMVLAAGAAGATSRGRNVCVFYSRDWHAQHALCLPRGTASVRAVLMPPPAEIRSQQKLGTSFGAAALMTEERERASATTTLISHNDKLM